MNVDQAIASFSALPASEKAKFLAALACELTIVAREGYEVGGTGLDDPAWVRAANEVQHTITTFLWALLREDHRRYPDDVLVRSVFEVPGLSDRVAVAFARSLSFVGAAA